MVFVYETLTFGLSLEGASAPSTLNLIESEDEDDGSLLSRGRPKVEENIYSDSNVSILKVDKGTQNKQKRCF